MSVALVKYEAARQALAECKRVDEAKEILNKAAALEAYARQANDYELEADAWEIRERAEIRLGEILVAAKAAGELSKGGRPSKTPADQEGVSKATLEQAGVDYKLSSRAQKKASISERAREAAIAAHRDRILAGRARGGPNLNGAGAVAQGRAEADDSLDYFPTPPWATRALIEHVLPVLGLPTRLSSAWEPACGEGHIAEVLRESCDQVIASDVHDYGHGQVLDFLNVEQAPLQTDWIITNPPFGDKSIPFVERSLERASNVAMFLRSQWAVEGIDRYERIFRDHPPTLVAFFVERVPLCKGRWDPDGSTLTAYCWLVWQRGRKPLPTFWIPPGCRERLSLPDDRERFTTHPVTRIEHQAAPPHDPETGELLEAPPAPAPEADGLEIPHFLKRAWARVVTA